MLLAFETVARSASACLMDDLGAVIAATDLNGGEAESGLAIMLDRLIRDHGRPSRLAVATGPGSFTGLRIGTVAARTLAWTEALPVFAVDALMALACQNGPGTWWTLVPLTRDAGFHAVIRVTPDQVATLVPTTLIAAPVPGGQIPGIPATVAAILRAENAVAVGPALTQRPGQAETWCPGIALGDPAPLRALGVARAARALAAAGQTPAAWDAILPAYHREPAPVLQRQAAQAALHAATTPPVSPVSPVSPATPAPPALKAGP
jgi:tRNA threonylcarbamoyl adenosine modification protein YeaZ